MDTEIKRLKLVTVAITLLFLVVLGRIAQLTFWHSEKKSSSDNSGVKRGPIIDRRGLVMAYTEEASTIAIAPREVLDQEFTARQIAERIDEPFDEIFERMQSRRQRTYYYLKRQVDNFPADQIMELNLPGVHREWEQRRIYPGGELAANLIGFVGRDRTRSLAGLERIFHDTLFHPELPGSNTGPTLQLSIDSALQRHLEDELKRGFASSDSKRATGIIMDIHTGEVLALANLPGYDPNEYHTTVPFQRANWAIRFNYEPGSTVKVFMAAMLINEKVVNLQEKFKCDGSISLRDTHVHCKYKNRIVKHGRLTLPQILERSCNVGIIKAMQRLNDKTIFRYMKALGFGEKTNILPDGSGETAGYFPKLNIWVPASSYYIPIGQSFSVTPIQLLRAASSLANGGQLYRPLLTRKLMASSGKVIESFPPVSRANPFLPSTNQTVTRLMSRVVSSGTGRGAYLSDIGVAGKTGTAQKSSPEGYIDEYVVSFIGFFPAENPRYSMLIMYDEPFGDASGGSLAAPVFGRTLQAILPLIGPDQGVIESSELQLPEPILPNINRRRLHDFRGLSAREALRVVSEIYDLPVEILGSGYVFRQEPPPGTSLSKVNKIHLYLDED